MRRFSCCVVLSAGWCWRATLRRSSHRATGRNREKVWLKQRGLEGSCLQLLRGVVVDGWLSAFSACRPKALQATPLQAMGETKRSSGGCYDGALQQPAGRQRHRAKKRLTRFPQPAKSLQSESGSLRLSSRGLGTGSPRRRALKARKIGGPHHPAGTRAGS